MCHHDRLAHAREETLDRWNEKGRNSDGHVIMWLLDRKLCKRTIAGQLVSFVDTHWFQCQWQHKEVECYFPPVELCTRCAALCQISIHFVVPFKSWRGLRVLWTRVCFLRHLGCGRSTHWLWCWMTISSILHAFWWRYNAFSCFCRWSLDRLFYGDRHHPVALGLFLAVWFSSCCTSLWLWILCTNKICKEWCVGRQPYVVVPGEIALISHPGLER